MSNLIAFRDRVSCTVEEACWATGLGRTTLYKLIKEGRVTARKIGRRTVILVPTLLAEIESSCAELTCDGPEAAPTLADVSPSAGVLRRVRGEANAELANTNSARIHEVTTRPRDPPLTARGRRSFKPFSKAVNDRNCRGT
jgi:excisionase family DNA binding protein